MAAVTTDPEPERSGLKKAIGRRTLLVFVVGDVLGAGIYALVGEVGAETGGAIWTAFTLALALAPTAIPIIGAIVSLGLIVFEIEGRIAVRALFILGVGAIFFVVSWFAGGRERAQAGGAG